MIGALRIRVLAVAVAAAVVATACASAPAVQGVAGTDVAALPADLLPPEMLGLQVKAEDTSSVLDTVEETYARGVGLYSMRREDVVQATLQVTKLTDESEWRSRSFRSTVVGRIGASRPREQRLGDTTVWVTSGTRQVIYVWFDGPSLFVLSIRDDFERPKSLLRAVMEVQA